MSKLKVINTKDIEKAKSIWLDVLEGEIVAVVKNEALKANEEYFDLVEKMFNNQYKALITTDIKYLSKLKGYRISYLKGMQSNNQPFFIKKMGGIEIFSENEVKSFEDILEQLSKFNKIQDHISEPVFTYEKIY